MPVAERAGSPQLRTIASLLEDQAKRLGNHPAILAPGRTALSYAALHEQIEAVSGQMRELGIGRRDRVAIVLPNGPEAATAFLATACAAIAAPLNPAYKSSEFEFYLSDLRPKALLVGEEPNPGAIEAARRFHIAILRLVTPPGAPAGSFRLDGRAAGRLPDGDCGGPDDTALLLHTSGTTSKPKLVPLTHGNLCASARNIAASLELDASDRCLNVMPLFHIHGLAAALLASVHAGASLVCSPGFRAAEFLGWLQEFRPTWYTAVPTIHQAVLASGKQFHSLFREIPLRFLRSCSAALAPPLMAELEDTFEVPVIEAYGMTEAAHQIACNPLPPGDRKPGSVGRAVGVEIAILDDNGEPLGAGARGEVGIRGETVTAGYLNNPAANEAAFVNGWFRTGDQGYFDPDGYLFLAGRLKEMINRGGEKIAPREIDEALLAHPAVAQAVAFAIPHPRLGEDVGAAVVLKEGCHVGAEALRQFAAERLADFKVPRLIRVVPEIPKGPTGKIQRIGLAAALGVEAGPTPQHTAILETEWEHRLAALWRDILGVKAVGREDDFFALGGDSVLATLVTARLSEEFGATLSLAEFLEAPVLAEVARRLEIARAPLPEGLIAIRSGGALPPLFCHPGVSGSLRGFLRITEHLAPDRPVYGFTLPRWSRELEEGGIGWLAEARIRQIQAVQTRGPYFLAGACLGGIVALEIGRRLAERGERVGLVAMLDTFNPAWRDGNPGFSLRLRHGAGRVMFHLKTLALGGPLGRKAYFRLRAQTFLRARRDEFGLMLYQFFRTLRGGPPAWLRKTGYALRIAERRYRPAPYSGRVVLFASSDPRASVYPAPLMGWQELLRGETADFRFPGGHESLAEGDSARQLAMLITACLKEACPPRRR